MADVRRAESGFELLHGREKTTFYYNHNRLKDDAYNVEK